MRERIVITGATGFIGNALVARHMAEGAIVHAVVRRDSRIGRLAPGVVRHSVDLGDRTVMRAVLAHAAPTTIYHLATSTGHGKDRCSARERDTAGIDLANLLGLLEITATLPDPPHSFVRTGSLAEYGTGPTPACEEQREEPQSAYAGGMAAGTHLVAGLQAELPFPVRTARLGLTYGPQQSSAFFIPWLIDRCLAGVPSQVRTPEQRRDLVFIDDIVDGLIALARTDRSDANVLNLSSGTAPTMREVATLIASRCDAAPCLIDYGTANCGAGSRVVCGDPSRAFTILGWRAACTLEDGLRRTIEARRNKRAAA